MDAQQQAVLDRFCAGAAQLQAELAQLSEMDLDWDEGPESWSIRQTVHHLAEGGEFFGFAILRALATPGSRVFFNDFPGNEPWAKALCCEQRPIEPALGLILAQRRYLAEVLSNLPDKWEHAVIYMDGEGVEQGRGTAREIVEMLSEHMEDHLGTIRRIKAAHGAK